MRTFFLQLFLSFWVATAGIIIAATIFFPDNDPGSPENLRAASAVSAQSLVAYAVAQYRTSGCAGLSLLGEDVFLGDQSGRSPCAGHPDEDSAAMIARVAATGKPEGRRFGQSWIEVRSIDLGPSGRWILAQRSAYVPRPWWPRLPPISVPVSILVTFFFAFILTRPVRRLSRAFRRFSAGDLNVRLPLSPRRWSGVGGADVQTLMSDFNDMADRIRELVEAQKMLVRDISHELRSPLARLRVALELAREDAPSHTPSFDRMEREADKVNALIGEMLSLSLMESTRQLPRPETFSLSDLMEELTPDMSFEAEGRGCGVSYVAPAEEFILTGQQEMLRRALENVIRNAIRYTPAGNCVEVVASGAAASNKSEGIQLTIEVRDRGPGVPEESLREIFRPFYRVDMAREGSSGGFGVGLAIAERAVHLHQGVISISNRVGGGLTVRMILPAARPGSI